MLLLVIDEVAKFNAIVVDLGRNEQSFRAAAGDIVRAHYGDIEVDRIAEQLSKNGSFLSLTFTVRAQSRDQIDALYRELTASDEILMVL